MNLYTCIKCNTAKTRILAIAHKNGVKKFIDNKGEYWERRTICPQCAFMYVCDTCGILKKKIPKKIPRGWYKCFDENGMTWNGYTCYECHLLEREKARRSNGIKAYDELSTPHLKKGRESEKAVKEFFERLGNKVEITNLRGPDLIIDTGNNKFTCEVKTVSIARRKQNTETLYVNAVVPSAQSNDYIAYVYRDKIYITTMEEHLSHVGKNGHRVVTKLLHDKYTNVLFREARKARQDKQTSRIDRTRIRKMQERSSPFYN